MDKSVEGVFKFNDFIEYQSESIVSKEILKTGKGTITLFAIDAGQVISEHSAPFDVLVQIIDGEAQIIISGKPHTVKSGESLIMPADKPHALKAEKQFKMLLVMIRRS